METGNRTYRLVTRSDFDGLVCAVLLREQKLIGDIKFVHPKDMQDGLIAISGNDITTNLPYVEGVHLAFDHHVSETIRVGEQDNYIIDPDAPSTARVVYNFFGGKDGFPRVSENMMEAVDKGDSAAFSEEEVLHPEDWNLLNFIMDARTGLGRFRNFRISNYQLMMDLIDYCTDHTIEEILALPDVAERIGLYFEHQDRFRSQIEESGRMDGNVLIVDLRDVETIYAGNRFVKYALFPDANVSIQIIWGFKKQNTVLTVGKSIFTRTCTVNIGELMLRYGGGGHENAGTCQVANDDAERVLNEVLETLKD
jgi:nanoRNase/pAp phosphatase (c-di-AMP/oligoRNAs hydrolase)